MALDAPTIAAVAALAVAAFALFIALAQVTQQYVGTGQLLRVCDRTVFGGLPGGGRLLWEGHQFRFRVVYSVPRIELLETFWPRGGMHTPSYASGTEEFPDLKFREVKEPVTWRNWRRTVFRPEERESRFEHVKRTPGEACWVSFVRTAQSTAYRSMRYSMIEGDADRCPSDLPVVPMPVSLRDVVVLAISVGLRVTDASFKGKSIFMQGRAGTITSAQHPVLGALIHFTPMDVDTFQLRATDGSLDQGWVSRMWGICHVVGRSYNSRDRRLAERSEDIWGRAKRPDRVRFGEMAANAERKTGRNDGAPGPSGRYAFTGDALPHSARYTTGRRVGGDGELNFEDTHAADTIPRGPYDGPWRFIREEMIEYRPRRRTLHVNPDEFADSIDYTRKGRFNLRSMLVWYEPWRRDLRSYWQRWRIKLRTEHDPSERPASSPPPSVLALESLSNVRNSADHVAYQSRSSSIDNHPRPTQIHPTPAHETSSSPGTRSPARITLPESRTSTQESFKTVGTEEDVFEVTSVASDDIPFPPDFLPEAKTRSPRAPPPIDETSRRWAAAQQKQRLRKEKASEEEADLRALHQAWKSGPYAHVEKADERAHLISYNVVRQARVDDTSSFESDDGDQVNSHDSEEPSPADKDDVGARQAQRERQRDARDDARTRRREQRERDSKVRHGSISWFWISQMDILPGYWATPWGYEFNYNVCTGAVAVIIEALMGFTQKGVTFRYFIDNTSGQVVRRCNNWLRSGGKTYPGYAINARGGIVVAGNYTPVRFEEFEARLPPIELARSYEYQVTPYPESTARDVALRTMELMALDSWLSLASRTGEILTGKADLIRNTPVKVHQIMQDFDEDFEGIDRTADEGGLQLISDIAANLMDRLDDERLGQAEQIFLLVALLRTVKVANCIVDGPATISIMDILHSDIQVNFV